MKKEDEDISSQRSNLQDYIIIVQEVSLEEYLRGVIPPRRNVVKIKLNDWPQSVRDVRGVVISQQPVCISDHRR